MKAPGSPRTLVQTLKELRQSPGVIGSILGLVPSQLLDQAQQQADPWDYLTTRFSGNQKLTPAKKRPYLTLFSACASQVAASHRLALIAAGIATINRDPVRELKTARAMGDTEAVTALSKEIVSGYDRTQARQEMSRSMKDKGATAKLTEIRSELRKRDVRRLGRTKAKARSKPVRITTLKADTIEQKLANILVSYWLEGPQGSPGFMFLSDENLARLIGEQINIRGISLRHIRGVRKKLGLLKATPGLKTKRIHSAKAADSL